MRFIGVLALLATLFCAGCGESASTIGCKPGGLNAAANPCSPGNMAVGAANRQPFDGSGGTRF